MKPSLRFDTLMLALVLVAALAASVIDRELHHPGVTKSERSVTAQR